MDTTNTPSQHGIIRLDANQPVPGDVALFDWGTAPPPPPVQGPAYAEGSDFEPTTFADPQNGTVQVGKNESDLPPGFVPIPQGGIFTPDHPDYDSPGIQAWAEPDHEPGEAIRVPDYNRAANLWVPGLDEARQDEQQREERRLARESRRQAYQAPTTVLHVSQEGSEVIAQSVSNAAADRGDMEFDPATRPGFHKRFVGESAENARNAQGFDWGAEERQRGQWSILDLAAGLFLLMCLPVQLYSFWVCSLWMVPALVVGVVSTGMVFRVIEGRYNLRAQARELLLDLNILREDI